VNFNVLTIKSFDKEAKRLSKKYPSLKNELLELIELLEENPTTGEPIGKDCYKIRLQIQSKGKGKSGGARVITNVYVSEQTVYLLSIYDKSEKQNLSNFELIKLLNDIE